MYLALLTLPALGSIVAGLLGRKVGVTGSHLITCTCLVLSALLSLIAFYEVGLCDSPVSINLVSWIDSELMDVSWGFLFDGLTVSMHLLAFNREPEQLIILTQFIIPFASKEMNTMSQKQ